MNILFVNYGDFTSNSLNHIAGFANALCAQGHACVVAVPSGKETISAIPAPLFIPALYSELLFRPGFFPDGRPAEILHAWTPREGVRKFIVAYQQSLSQAARVIIHLEDNEQFLMESYTGRPFEDLRRQGPEALDVTIVDGLPHPLRHRALLRLADAVTVITDSLRPFVPTDVPVQVLPPGVDFRLYHPQPADPSLRRELGLLDEEKVIVFTGSITFANEAEMRELYLAVALLNQRGIPTRLIRTGFNTPSFLNGLAFDHRAYVLDLGFVEKSRLPRLLALADVLVQPGRRGRFNDYRLPSKLPEFLATGRPVVLPRANIAAFMQDGVDALFLDDGTPEEIAARCQRIFGDPALAATLAEHAATFARRHFDLALITPTLAALYERVAAQPSPSLWQLLSKSTASELTLLQEQVRTKVSRLQPASFADEAHAAAWQDLASLTEELALLARQTEGAGVQRDSNLHLVQENALKVRKENTRLASEAELTRQHAANLERLLAETSQQLSQTQALTSQHIRNLEATLEHQRQQVTLSQQHVDNQQSRLDAIQAALRESEVRAAETRTRLGEIEKYAREQSTQLGQARARIAETERIARERIEEANQKIGTLTDRLAHAEAVVRTREQKIARMSSSFSWQITSPLRALRRLVLDSSTPKAATAAPSSVPATASASSAIFPLTNGAGTPPTLDGVPPEAPAPAPAATAPAPHAYTYNFDHPRSWNTSSNKLLILGWCFENAGAPIKGLRARFGDQIIEGIYGSKRLDVLASVGGKKQAEYCGIKVDIKTSLGDHHLAIEVLHEDGWNAYFETTVHVGKPGDPTELSEYEKWCEAHEALSPDDLKGIEAHIARFAKRPVISVIMPTYNPPETLLVKAIESVRAQLYPHWELCIADDASTEPHVREVLQRYARKYPRIKVTFREKNGHISNASNTAIELATGDYLALFDHDDVLAKTALYEVAAELDAHPEAQLIYTDEDKIDGEDRRFDPYFKPDWNPDLLHGQNYTSHLSVFRRQLIESLGGFRTGFEGSQDWDLTLRAIEKISPAAIRHVPKVLYHWRAIPGSTALQLSEKSYPVDAAKRALLDHFQRLGQPIELATVPGDHWRIKYPLPTPPPLASILIPTRNAVKLVRQAIDSIVSKTTYPRYEILIVDNGSDDPEALAYFASLAALPAPAIRTIRYDAPFNYSAINNFGVRHAAGEVVVLLNNDVEVINADWLDELVTQACRPRIGAVGAMLYYPLNTVQHAGVILGLGGVAGHPFKEFPRGDQGQKNRLRLVQNYSAVTGACLALRKERYLEVGGLNEENLPVAFNDVDLCCKLLRAGYRNLWTPHAELYHHESATRGIEDTPQKKARFQSEIDYMMETWGELLANDPAYNPNLTLVGEDFSTAYLPRTRKRWLAES